MVNEPTIFSGSPKDGPDTDSWGPHSNYLLSVEAAEQWRGYARSMTAWMRAYGVRINRSMPVLWRYKSSGRYYCRKRDEMAKKGLLLPSLAEIPSTVSAETLELFEKVERVASKELIESMQSRVLLGQVSKSEVKCLWNGYKHLLDGKNARGMGVSRPQVELTRDATIKQQCLRILANNVRGAALRADCHLITINPNRVGVSEHFGGIDMLGMEPTAGMTVTVHAFEVVDFKRLQKGTHPGHRRATNINVQFWWVVSPDRLLPQQLRQVTPNAGVIVAAAEGFEVMRYARVVLREHSEGERFLNRLLLLVMEGEQMHRPR